MTCFLARVLYKWKMAWGLGFRVHSFQNTLKAKTNLVY